jgi:hypothetical protein
MFPMLHSAPKIVKRGLAGIALAAVGVLGILYVQELAKIDPFARLKQSASGLDDRIGIRLENVRMRHYKGSKLMTNAVIDRVDITRDRSRFDLYGVHDGVYRGEKAEVLFSSKEGEWNDVRRVLEVKAGSHIKSKDFDLEVPDFKYTAAYQRLHVPGTIKGKLGDGVAQGSNLLYNLRDRSYSVKSVRWSGELALNLQDTGDPKPTKWDITGSDMDAKGGKQIFLNGVADSGDTIIKAPHIERDVKTDVVTATGRVYYYSVKANMVCDKVVIYRKEKRAILTGTVEMLVKAKGEQGKVLAVELPPFKPIVPDAIVANRPKPDKADDQKKQEDQVRSSENLRKYPIKVFAQRIEYWYGEGNRKADITGTPQARQELPEGGWRHVWAHHARYDGQAETLRLFSDPASQEVQMKNSIGDDLMAKEWFEVSTVENNEDMKGKGIHGSIFGDPEKEPDLPTRPATNPPPTKGTAVKPVKKTSGGGLSGPIGRLGRS